MSLDLGTLIATADIVDTPFSRKYTGLVRMLGDIGLHMERTGGSAATLDSGLVGIGASADEMTTGLTRADTALREAGLSASETTRVMAATGAEIQQVADVTTELGLAQSRLVQSELRAAATGQRLITLRATATANTEALTAAEGDLAAARAEEGASEEKVAAATERVNVLRTQGAVIAGRLASTEASLVAANDRVTLSQERLEKASGWTSRYKAAVMPLTVAGVAIAAGFVIAGRAATEFDAKMALNESLLRSNSKSTQQLVGWMGQLRQQALTVGTQYGYTAGQVADAQGELIKAGISVKDILGGALTGALTLAAAGQEDVAEATETAAIAMTQFNLKGKDVPHIADLLAAGADKALGSVADLSEGLKYGGLASSQAGESLENTIGTLAEFAQAGLIGSSAGAAMAMMLQNLQKPSAQAAAVMDQYDISLYNANGTTKTYTELAGNLHKSLWDLPPAERAAALATLFTARARRAATILTKDGAKANAEWTKSVNDQGFAAAQASGKLDSLSGDWLKLKAATQSALIGTGEGAQGPLREMVQDATTLIEVWSKIPAPIRNTVEVLIALGGATALAGAAALVAVPKWAAMNAELAQTRIGAISATGALGATGKVLGGLAILQGIDFGVGKLDGLLTTSPDVDKMTQSLLALGKSGETTGALLGTFGPHLDTFAKQAHEALDPGWFDRVNESMSKIPILGLAAKVDKLAGTTQDLDQVKKNFSSLDDALTQLAGNNALPIAKEKYDQLSKVWVEAGGNASDLTRLFPHFADAVAQAGIAAGNTAADTQTLQQQLVTLTASTKSATDAAKAYADQLHANADPVFALNKSLVDLAAKQSAASGATQKYGADSRQARQANLDLASSSLDVEATARALSAAVQDGSSSVKKSRAELRAWVKDGLLTQAQANQITKSFGGLITKADQISGALVRGGKGFVEGEQKMTTATARMVAKIEALLAELGPDAEKSGEYLSLGLAAGIEARSGVPIAKAIALGNQAAHGVDFGAGNASPSKKTFKSGVFLVMGAELGMDAEAPHLYAMATKIGATAASMVDQAIAHATMPAITDPSVLARMLASATGKATTARRASLAAHDTYKDLKAHSDALDKEAKSADWAAKKAHSLATAMADGTTAQKAAKKAAEDHADSLSKLATQADHTAKEADHAADHAQKTWQRLQTAASKATQKAVTDAGQLVSAIQSDLDQITGAIDDFKSGVASGLTGDYSLATIFGGLSDAASSAADDLSSAKSALDDAQDAVNKAGTGATADQLNDLATAQQNYNASLTQYQQVSAQASVGGVQAGLDQVLAQAQKFAGDLQALVGDGASSTLISQLVAMGPQAGDALASQLVAAGATSVGQLSSTLDQIASYAQSEADSFGSQFADSLSAPFYPGGVTAMDNFIKGLISEFPALASALTPLMSTIDGILGIGSTGTTGGGGLGGAAGTTAGKAAHFVGASMTAATISLPSSPMGGDGAALVATLHPADRALLTTVAQQMQAATGTMADGVDAMVSRPAELVLTDGGKTVIGEVANDYRQSKRDLGNTDFR